MHKVLYIFIGLLMSFTALVSSHAQGQAGGQESQGSESLAEVGAQLANPVSSVWSIVFQNNFTFLEGEPSDKTRFRYNLNFQPVLPIPLTDNWNLITRPVFPLLIGQPVYNPESGFHGRSGLGDIAMVNLISPNKPSGFLWGIGPTWIFPTATKQNLGQQKWQVGPAAVGLYLSKDWIFGAFPQQWWSFAGKDNRPDTSMMNIQYFVWRLLPGAWQVGTGAPNITINWKADDDNKVNLPIGLGVAKTVKLGELPVKFQLEGSYSVAHEDVLGQRWNIRLTITPVIPRLITNAIF
ncbi:MAG: hypothetical protein KC473_09675 [Candidatus Dadabacteria bacterium]|nr:hypothetical protein [Candidatus Dadabacteria bacterium]